MHFKLLPLLLLAACGYKGDLYLPQPNDPNRFGVVQTSFTPPPADTATEPPQ